MAQSELVSVGDRDYGRVIYKDGSRHYCVITERRNQYGKRIQRTLNSKNIISKIDKAIEEMK